MAGRFLCPCCRKPTGPQPAPVTYVTAMCPVCLGEVHQITTTLCGHFVCPECCNELVGRSDMTDDIPPPPGTDSDPPPPPPPPRPQWMSRWTHNPYPSFPHVGNRVMWVFSPFSYQDWSLIDVTTGDLWRGNEHPPSPIPGGDVRWSRSAKRWIWSPPLPEPPSH